MPTPYAKQRATGQGQPKMNQFPFKPLFLERALVEMKWKLATNGHNWQTHNTGNGARDCYLRLLTEKNVVPLWGLAFVRIIWFFLKKTNAADEIKSPRSSNCIFKFFVFFGALPWLHIMFTSFGCTLGVHNPKGPGNQPAVQLIAAPLPCDGPAWATGFRGWAECCCQKWCPYPPPIRFSAPVISCGRSGGGGRSRALAQLGNVMFLLEKKIDKIRVQGTLTASSSCFLCSLSALAAHNLQVISMRSLRSAKIPKGPGYQKAMQLVLAHSSFSMRLLRPRDSKNRPEIRSLSRLKSPAAAASQGPVKRGRSMPSAPLQNGETPGLLFDRKES